jgi:GT2 family glycosyltransferase
MEETAPAPPRITVLILSYNTAPRLRQCLSALEASQGRDQFEVIVVDNGSVDDSPTLDTEFPAITVMRLPRNFGATKALNIGMRTAAADNVFFLAPEVIVEANTVTALADRLDADQAVVALCPLLVDESGRPRTEVARLPRPEAMSALWHDPESLPRTTVDVNAEAVAVEYPGRKAVAVRKGFIKAFNWLDDRYGEFGGDLEVAFQIRRSGKKALLIPSIRATLLPSQAPPFDGAALATLAADRAHGAAVFLVKHFGWFAGLKLRIAAALYALGHLQFRVLIGLLSGQKIDGSQTTL